MNISMKEAIKRGLRPGVILTTLIIFGTLIAIGTVNGETFITMLNSIFVSLMINGGWLISLGTRLYYFSFIHSIPSNWKSKTWRKGCKTRI